MDRMRETHKDAPSMLISEDGGASWEEYRVLSKVQANLDEIDQRYKRYKMKIALRFMLAILALLISWWLWM